MQAGYDIAKPMSDATRQRLTRLAEQISSGGRKVSPMQVAAQILEDALNGFAGRIDREER